MVRADAAIFTCGRCMFSQDVVKDQFRERVRAARQEETRARQAKALQRQERIDFMTEFVLIPTVALSMSTGIVIIVLWVALRFFGKV